MKKSFSVYALFIIIFLLLIPGNQTTQKQHSEPAGEKAEPIVYRVENIECTEFYGEARLNYKILISLDTELLEKTTADIVQKITANHNVKAFYFEFFRNIEDLAYHASFGTAEWSSANGWSYKIKAPPQKTSEKKRTSDFEMEIADSLSLMLVESASPYNKIPPKGVNLNNWVDEYNQNINRWKSDKVTEVAKKYNLSIEKVEKIISKAH